MEHKDVVQGHFQSSYWRFPSLKLAVIEMLWGKCDIAWYYPPQTFRGFLCGRNKLEGICEIDVGHCCQTALISVHLRWFQHWEEKKSLFIHLFNSSNVKAALTHRDEKRWRLCFNINWINQSMFFITLYSVLLFCHMFSKQKVSQWLKWCSGSDMQMLKGIKDVQECLYILCKHCFNVYKPQNWHLHPVHRTLNIKLHK